MLYIPLFFHTLSNGVGPGVLVGTLLGKHITKTLLPFVITLWFRLCMVLVATYKSYYQYSYVNGMTVFRAFLLLGKNYYLKWLLYTDCSVILIVMVPLAAYIKYRLTFIVLLAFLANRVSRSCPQTK
jgi:hypothetical protein